MTDSRQAVLGAIRRSLGREQPPARDSESRASTHPCAAPRPLLGADPLHAFRARAQGAAATVTIVSSAGEVVDAVTGYLAQQALAPRALVASHALLAGLPWPAGMAPQTRPAGADDLVAVTAPFAGVAETGSVALLSGPETPMTLNFLSDHLICVLPVGRIVPHLEDLWALLRTEGRPLPRALTLVTGPSRTADVEQTIQMGAHGPRSLHVVLVARRRSPADPPAVPGSRVRAG